MSYLVRRRSHRGAKHGKEKTESILLGDWQRHKIKHTCNAVLGVVRGKVGSEVMSQVDMPCPSAPAQKSCLCQQEI